ncbi:unnamed protein product [Didymodactylos carnosus]|uniref:Uncharacterized protein n=1 Tax=Didymodactylos carnosus TaxID=1234261 RepID=A0A814HB38_9BILA|nr:unnamed protein product [Didymodactylos carnosus]CAF3778526.1 unnamed protein product [Didymodactylos carnosus]
MNGNSLVLLPLFAIICLFSSESVATEDCSIYKSDLNIISLNPFYVRTQYYPTITSAAWDGVQITAFLIKNDRNPSSNIVCLKNLTTLTVINTNLTLTADIRNLLNLTRLVIQSNNETIGEHLPAELGELALLTYLELVDLGQLKDIPQELKQLQTLKLNGLPNFENISENLLSLQTLQIQNCKNFTQLPSTVNQFKLLSSLVITETNLNTLKLNDLSYLSAIQVSKNPQLTTVTLINLSFLSVLDLSMNLNLTELTVDNLQKLYSLDLSYCQLEIFPETILKLSSLEILRLQYNRLTSLPEQLSTSLPKLKVLYLSSNKFQGQLPLKLPVLANLKELYLSRNQLTTLETIGQYQQLSILNADFNNITAIPMEIMQLLLTLQNLDLHQNSLTSVPYQMSNMAKLQTLNVQLNDITYQEKQNIQQVFRQTSISVTL